MLRKVIRRLRDLNNVFNQVSDDGKQFGGHSEYFDTAQNGRYFEVSLKNIRTSEIVSVRNGPLTQVRPILKH